MPLVLFKALGVNTYSIYLICLLKHKWKKYYLAWDLFSFNSLPWVHLAYHPDNRPWCDSPKLCRKRAQKQPAWASWQLLCQLTGPPGSTSPVSLSECGMPLSPSAHSRGWWSFPLPLQPHPSGTRYKKRRKCFLYTVPFCAYDGWLWMQCWKFFNTVLLKYHVSLYSSQSKSSFI